MKKNNNQGFTLIETLAVSTFVIGTLIYLFIQFSNVKRSYDISFRYNTISGLYSAKLLSNYLKETGYDNLKTLLSESSTGFVDITDCNLTNGDKNYCKEIVKKADMKVVIFVNENLDTARDTLTSSITYDEELNLFVKRLITKDFVGMNRIIIEYADNTFASIVLE